MGDFAISESHARLIWAGVKPSTRHLYDTGVRSYLKVCNLHRIDNPFPATVRTLSVYITALAYGEYHVKRVKSTTIQKYLSSIRSWHVDVDMPLDVFSNEHLKLLISGAGNLFPDTSTDKRQPIDARLLEAMLSPRATASEDSTTQLNLDAAFTLAFMAFLRMGEFTWPDSHIIAPGFSQQHVAQKHVTFLPNHMIVVLPMSKSDKANKGVAIPVTRTNNPICAYNHMRRLFDSRPYDPEAPLFAMASGSFTRQKVIDAMHRRIAALGLPAHEYLGHSFRKGAALAAAAAGILEEECMILGRWKGSAVKRYFRNHPETILTLQRRMLRDPNTVLPHYEPI